MEESVTYQAIVREGVIKGKREDLLDLGTQRFGVPEPNVQQRLSSVADVEELRRLLRRVLEVSNWAELFGDPPPKPRGKRSKKTP